MCRIPWWDSRVRRHVRDLAHVRNARTAHRLRTRDGCGETPPPLPATSWAATQVVSPSSATHCSEVKYQFGAAAVDAFRRGE